MSRPKLILWVLGVFLIGAFVGGVATYEYQRREIRAFMEGSKNLGARIAARMAKELKLTDSQRPAFETVMAEVQEGIHDIRRQARPQIEAVLAQAKPKILAILTPQQREIFEKMEARRAQRHKNGPPGGDLPPPPPPDDHGPPPPPPPDKP